MKKKTIFKRINLFKMRKKANKLRLANKSKTKIRRKIGRRKMKRKLNSFIVPVMSYDLSSAFLLVCFQSGTAFLDSF